MSSSLPLKPRFEQLKKQAKDLLKSHKLGDANGCETLKLIDRYSKLTTQKILKTPITLRDAQFAIALQYGFKSWKALKEQVESMQKKPKTPEGENKPELSTFKGIMGLEEKDSISAEDYDESYDDAIALVTKTRQASITMIQRHFRIRYNRAVRIVEMMEREGVVGPSDGVKPREVLVRNYEDMP